MTNNSNNAGRDYRVTLAWIILAVQIIGVLWMLLAGSEQLTAMPGDDSGRVADVAEAPEAAAPETAAETAPTEVAVAQAGPTATTAAAESASTAVSAGMDAVVAPEEVLIEPSGVASDWLATLIEGSAADPASGRPAIPPHLLLTFVDPDDPDQGAGANDGIDLSEPQVRIIPVAVLMEMLQDSGDEDGQRSLDDLLSLLQSQQMLDEASVPMPPILGGMVQNFVSRPGFREFGGGSGIGYVTNISRAGEMPDMNTSGLNYVYQGLTADGEQYVFMSWPVDASFMPASEAEAEEAAEALAADPAGFFVALREQVQAAADADISPPLGELAEVVRSLSIGGEVAAIEDDELSQSAFDAIGFNWYWTGSAGPDGEETAVDTPQNYSLVLWPDGTYNLRADCNVGGGRFTYDEIGGIQLNPGAMTLAACPAGSRGSEFLASLLNARSVNFDESGDMILTLEDGGRLTFANVGLAEANAPGAAGEQPAAAEAGLSGITLQWPGFTNAAGDEVAASDPENYVLTLLPDGTFQVVAGCNVGGGTYTYEEGGALQLNPIRLTRAACPEGSLGDEFINFLSNVNAAAVDPSGAITLTTADGSSSTFVNVGETGEMTAAEQPETAQEQPVLSGDPLNTVWNWTGGMLADGSAVTVDEPESYYLVLIDDGTYAFRADCNNGAGGYTLDGADLTLLPAAVTLVACPEGSLSDQFVDSLGRARAIDFDEDGNLLITLDDGAVLTFGNGGPFTGIDTGTGGDGGEETADTQTDGMLINTPWQWSHFRDAKQDFDVSGAYSITFNEDGTVAVTADCNSGTGSYSFPAEGELTISIRAITLAACPAGSLGNTFVEFLNQAGSYTISNGQLVIELMADGGTMTLVAAQ